MLITLPLVHGSQKRPGPAPQELRAMHVSHGRGVSGDSVPSWDGVTRELSHSITALTAPGRPVWESCAGKGTGREMCPALLPADVGHSCPPAWGPAGPRLPLCQGLECPASSSLSPPGMALRSLRLSRIPGCCRRATSTPAGRLLPTFGTAHRALANQANWLVDNINYHVAH